MLLSSTERLSTWKKIRFESFKRTIESVGHADDSLAADLNALYLRHRFEDIELYTDVIPTLDSLSSQFSLGLISIGNGYPERCGLPERFGFVVFSQDVGVAKPDAAIFRAACRKAGCRTSELMHVGDSLQTDVFGANAVGAESVWLNRDGVRNNSVVRPDHEIRSLTELIDIVALPRSSSHRSI